MALDLGIKDNFIPDRAAKTPETAANKTPLLTVQERGWSIQNAVDWSARLIEAANLGEKAALRNFLSLYSLTINDNSPNNPNGGWEDIQVTNGAAVKQALFGDGTLAQSAIQNVWLGQPGQNEYTRMNQILRALGVNSGTSRGGDHWHHYHVDFKTPVRAPLPPAPNRLEAASLAPSSNMGEPFAAAMDSALRTELLDSVKHLFGEDEMMSMDTWPIDAQTIAIVAMADQSTIAQKKRVIATCSPIYWKDEANWVSPEWTANRYIQEYERSLIKHPSYKFPTVSDAKLVKAPAHGRLEITADNARNAGIPSWTYYPNPGFIGTDRMEFDVQIAGITIRVLEILKINKIPTEDLDSQKLCGYKPMQLN